MWISEIYDMFSISWDRNVVCSTEQRLFDRPFLWLCVTKIILAKLLTKFVNYIVFWKSDLREYLLFTFAWTGGGGAAD